jgi:dephospho-CoA kinase
MATIIGLTGGYCAGKNEAALCIEESGFRVIDVDKLGHKALELKTEALVRAFGRGILNPRGEIDRRALGAIVFADPETLRRHEFIRPCSGCWTRSSAFRRGPASTPPFSTAFPSWNVAPSYWKSRLPC